MQRRQIFPLVMMSLVVPSAAVAQNPQPANGQFRATTTLPGHASVTGPAVFFTRKELMPGRQILFVVLCDGAANEIGKLGHILVSARILEELPAAGEYAITNYAPTPTSMNVGASTHSFAIPESMGSDFYSGPKLFDSGTLKLREVSADRIVGSVSAANARGQAQGLPKVEVEADFNARRIYPGAREEVILTGRAPDPPWPKTCAEMLDGL